MLRPVLFTTAVLGLVLAAAARSGAHTADSEDSAQAPIPEAVAFTSRHSGTFNGRVLSYTARAGETYLRDDDGKPTATLFTFDYLAADTDTEANRPVTFVWNGGPGSASLWLHMGSLGPKRVVVPSDATHPGPPPYPIIDAPETVLDVTDLVFFDPVGTGYSRALGEADGPDFWGLVEDAETTARFIRQWLTEHGRWNSPRFLLGESFGTTRAAAVAELLEDDFMIGLNGLIFVSQALNYAGSTPYIRDNLISHITYFPTMAATALYHGKVDAGTMTTEQWVQAAREFATAELLQALWRGNTLDAATRETVRDGIVRFTGLSAEYVDRANLRVDGSRFAKELLREEGKAIGRNDARYVMDPVDDLTATTNSDASSNAIGSAYKSALLTYLHDDLGVKLDRTYLAPSDSRLGDEWNWNPKGRGKNWEPHWVDTTPALVKALEVNPQLNVLVASGYYDLITPFFDAEYTLNRYNIPAGRIQYTYYQGGHMMYLNEDARLAFLTDVRTFIEAQLKQGAAPAASHSQAHPPAAATEEAPAATEEAPAATEEAPAATEKEPAAIEKRKTAPSTAKTDTATR
ncbi:MAG: serine carboxypeptidase [Pseudomonadota bacterium]